MHPRRRDARRCWPRPCNVRPNWESAPGLFLLEVDGVARYLVREGREIVVERAGNDDGAVTAFLLGSVLAACLQQRGILTLHASAMATDDGAVLFAGHSGVGKSTLMAALTERGYAMLSDDVTGIVRNGGDGPRGPPGVLLSPAVGGCAEGARMGGSDAGSRARGNREVLPAGRALPGDAATGAHGLRAHESQPGRHRDGDAACRGRPRGRGEARLPQAVRARPRAGSGAVPDAGGASPGGGAVVRVAKPLGGFPLAELADRIEACLREGAPPPAERTRPARSPLGGGALRRGTAVSRQARGPRRRPDEAPGDAPARSIVWLASYPRSGNTWLRALLTNYLNGSEHPASIGALAGGAVTLGREVFDDYLGLSSSDLTNEEILNHRPRLHELLAAELPRPSFVKVHDACLHTAGGVPLFPPGATLGAVYLVRNPLDVAVSYAHFWNWPVARAVAELSSPDATFVIAPTGNPRDAPAAALDLERPRRELARSGGSAGARRPLRGPVGGSRGSVRSGPPLRGFRGGARARFAGSPARAFR